MCVEEGTIVISSAAAMGCYGVCATVPFWTVAVIADIVAKVAACYSTIAALQWHILKILFDLETALSERGGVEISLP